MKLKIFALILLFLFSACSKNKKEDIEKTPDQISPRVSAAVSGNFYELNSGKFSYKFPLSKMPFRKVIVLNASLVGYLVELGLEDRIAGVSSPEYIYSPKIHELIAAGKISNVGNEQKYNIEKIVALQPDLIITNHISSFENTYDALSKLTNAEVLFLDEYLEQHPLEKAAYLKIFGQLFGKQQEADARLNLINSNYRNWSAQAMKKAERPVIIANEIYGGQWFMPGGRTQLAHFLKDSGGNYILADDGQENAVPLSFEEVLIRSEKASLWVNAGNHHSKSSLTEVNSNYRNMNVFRTGKIYALTAKERGKANDFFESGVVRADLVLRDYIKIIHPDLFADVPLQYMSELK